ncbi:MAG: ATP-binding cassette domain-containing protein [Desulfobacteraceae bacterium]|nr:ATP-binding cassette domain-containing protein [Desulfobacteraceae bacterium]
MLTFSAQCPLITMHAVTLRKGQAHLLPDTSWQICRGQQWVILGPNGSGKSTLARAVRGDVAHVRGTITRHVPEAGPERIGYLSFELQEELFQRAERLAESLFFGGRSGPALTVAQLLGSDVAKQAASRLFAALDVGALLDRGIRSLSNGEIRKVLILRALLQGPEILILDEPFAGLDRASRKTLARLIGASMARGVQVIMVTGRGEEILPEMTHALVIGQGRVLQWGRKEEVLTSTPASPIPGDTPAALGGIPQSAPQRTVEKDAEPLVVMDDVCVAYGHLVVLERLNWRVRRGEHWAVVGPNGSGKSTLLGLITGENLQVYANRVRLFGRKRGEGDSLGDIRRRIGAVSAELQLRYRRAVSVKEAVLSGFFDSIGLYRRADDRQEHLATQWLACIGLSELADAPFLSLSYGQRRLVLLARAMVKSPELLLLDEPCQGLDPANRSLVLALMEEIGRRNAATMIYVTHHPAEIVPCIRRVLRLEKRPVPVTSPDAPGPVRPACPAAR